MHRNREQNGGCQKLGEREKVSCYLVGTDFSKMKNVWALVAQQYERIEMSSNLPKVTQLVCGGVIV